MSNKNSDGLLDIEIEIKDPRRFLTPKKLLMIKALEKNMGIITPACKAVGITRTTHYAWCKDDENYKAAVDDVMELQIDFAESNLLKKIKEGSTAETIFYLKCKGKKRGYVEKQEQEIKVVYGSKRDEIAVDPDDWDLE